MLRSCRRHRDHRVSRSWIRYLVLQILEHSVRWKARIVHLSWNIWKDMIPSHMMAVLTCSNRKLRQSYVAATTMELLCPSLEPNGHMPIHWSKTWILTNTKSFLDFKITSSKKWTHCHSKAQKILSIWKKKTKTN